MVSTENMWLAFKTVLNAKATFYNQSVHWPGGQAVELNATALLMKVFSLMKWCNIVAL